MQSLLLATLLAAPFQESGAAPSQRSGAARDVVHYDWIDEAGVLRGGTVAVDPTDPLLANVPSATPPALRGSNVTVLDNGPPQNRVDLVFVGDGYTAGELGDYAAHVDAVWPVFLAEPPFDTYASYFNVHRVDVVSAESGVDNDPVQGISRNTALDMGYWCSGIERLLCVNVNKAVTQAGAAPAVDQILAVANSTKYGGAGYSDLGTLAGDNGSTIEVALHEFGHSFGDLADEYDYGGPQTYTGGEPPEKNVTTFKKNNLINNQRKWWRWLDHPNVDHYEGAKYSQFGIYRPTWNSKMRSLGRPFEEVNTERLIREIYLLVDPIDASSPAAGTYPATQPLSVTPMQPIGHALAVTWFVDGVRVPGTPGHTLVPAELGLPAGFYQVTVQVRDETDAVRDQGVRNNLLTSTRSWTVWTNGRVRAAHGPPNTR